MSSKLIFFLLLTSLVTTSWSLENDTNVPKHDDCEPEPIEEDYYQDLDTETGPKEKLLNQFLTNRANTHVQRIIENLLKTDPEEGTELVIMNRIALITREDLALGNMLYNLYQKTLDYDSRVESIIKYITTADASKNSKDSILKIDRQLSESLRNFKDVIFDGQNL